MPKIRYYSKGNYFKNYVNNTNYLQLVYFD